ncbi:MAG: hypothetical protein JW726_09075 [Anaerolineales bacterium]|nr:hypothetical protein [Anaerolineales bacterium]
MYSQSFSRPPGDTNSDFIYDELIRDGISAAKRGNKNLANTLLLRATTMRANDATPWLWLSSTTDDPQEQRGYLERALAADPSNVAARRGMVMLSDKLDKSRLVTADHPVPVAAPGELSEAKGESFACPKCGGRMVFDVHQSNLACPYCGFVKETEKVLAPDAAEQVIDFVMPTTRAYTWAQSQQRVECQACGAVTILPPGQTADRCAYCGATRFITSKQVMELVDPQVIALPRIDLKQATARARKWLGKGILAPDDLSAKSSTGMQLQPAYYPFWTFDGTLEVPWNCEVNAGSNDRPHWEQMSGAEYEMFDDLMVPGVRKMPLSEMKGFEPFNLKDLVEFKPDYLAGWNALTYDYPLADASNRAQSLVRERVTRFLSTKVAAGRPIRNFRLASGKWVDMTYKHILLPLYVGNYTYHGKPFRVFVNGQTGKVSGQKPRDTLKAAIVVAGGIFLILVIVFLLYILLAKFM